ncbi:MAG: SHOCT domain-containing protein [Thermodesulfobacteriota bacterium]
MGGSFAGPWFAMIVVPALTILLGWLFIARKGQSVESQADDALDLLRQRYAAGEIDETEYVRRRENLS